MICRIALVHMKSSAGPHDQFWRGREGGNTRHRCDSCQPVSLLVTAPAPSQSRSSWTCQELLHLHLHHGRLRAACDEDGPARRGAGLQPHHWLPGPLPGRPRGLHVQVPVRARGVPLLPGLSLLQHSPLHGEKQQTRQSSNDPGNNDSHWDW